MLNLSIKLILHMHQEQKETNIIGITATYWCCFSPEEQRMAFIIGHRVESAPWGEIQTTGFKHSLPLELWKIGEHCETWKMDLKIKKIKVI